MFSLLALFPQSGKQGFRWCAASAEASPLPHLIQRPGNGAFSERTAQIGERGWPGSRHLYTRTSDQALYATVHDRPWVSLHGVVSPLYDVNRFTRVAKTPGGRQNLL